MAVNFERKDTGTAAYATGITFSATVPEGLHNSILIVFVGEGQRTGLNPPATIKWDGDDLTLIAGYTGYAIYNSAYYLLNPSAKTADLVITSSDRMDWHCISAVFSGVDLEDPISSVAYEATSLTATPTVVVPDDIQFKLIDCCVATNQAGTIVDNADQTRIDAVSSGNYGTIAVSYKTINNTTLGYSNVSGRNRTFGFCLNAAASFIPKAMIF